MTPPMIPEDVLAALTRLSERFDDYHADLSILIAAARDGARARTDLLDARGDLVIWHEWWARLPERVRAAHPMPVRTPHPVAGPR